MGRPEGYEVTEVTAECDRCHEIFQGKIFYTLERGTRGIMETIFARSGILPDLQQHHDALKKQQKESLEKGVPINNEESCGYFRINNDGLNLTGSLRLTSDNFPIGHIRKRS
jgi:hypothetical protein